MRKKLYVSISLFLLLFGQLFVSPAVTYQAFAQEDENMQGEQTASLPSPTPQTETVEEDHSQDEATPTPTSEASSSPLPSPSPDVTDIPSPTPSPTISPSTDDGGDNATATNSAQLLQEEKTVSESAFVASPSATLEDIADKDSNPTQTSEQLVQVSQEATVTTTTAASANTGHNSSQAEQHVLVATGTATASASQAVLVNTTVSNSQHAILSLDVTDDLGDIDLNKLWQELSNGEDPNTIKLSFSVVPTVTFSSNEACISTEVSALATTGNNQAKSEGTADMTTGSATAVANATTVANTTILNSTLLIAFINIFGGENTRILLPRPELFLFPTQQETHFDPDPTLSSFAAIASETVADANTGSNSMEAGSNLLVTGDAYSYAQNVTLANVAFIGQRLFQLFVTQTESPVTVASWISPEKSQQIEAGAHEFKASSIQEQAEIQTTGGEKEELSYTSIIEQTATISSIVRASADTGHNHSDAPKEASLQTGVARAIANSLQLVNTTVLHSSLFMGFINIFGNWNGEVVFAYPQVSVQVSDIPNELHPGDVFDMAVSYANTGDDSAQNVSVSVTLPRGAEYISDTSGKTPVLHGNTLFWDVGTVAKNQHHSFSLHLHIRDDFSFEETVSLLDLFAPKVYAADFLKQKAVRFNAQVATSDPQSDTQDDASSIQVLVTQIQTEDENLEDQNNEGNPAPVLSLTAQNNVNTFVYPADTITFTIAVKNESDVPSYNTIITHTITADDGSIVRTSIFPVGTIQPHKRTKLTFGMTVPKEGIQKSSEFVTTAQATGYNEPRTEEHMSNTAQTQFLVRLRQAISKQITAQASQTQVTPQILGTTTETVPPSVCNTSELYPYVGLFLLSSYFFVRELRRILQKGWTT